MPHSSQEKLTQLVSSLSPEQRRAVEAFIRYLQERDSPGSEAELSTAIDEFVHEHSDLLRRLAR